jgi:hypothetical protein
MKKSKTPDQPKPDFKNRPFKPLKGLVPSIPVPVKKIATYNAQRKPTTAMKMMPHSFCAAAEEQRNLAMIPMTTQGWCKTDPEKKTGSSSGRRSAFSHSNAEDRNDLFATIYLIGN